MVVDNVSPRNLHEQTEQPRAAIINARAVQYRYDPSRADWLGLDTKRTPLKHARRHTYEPVHAYKQPPSNGQLRGVFFCRFNVTQLGYRRDITYTSIQYNIMYTLILPATAVVGLFTSPRGPEAMLSTSEDTAERARASERASRSGKNGISYNRHLPSDEDSRPRGIIYGRLATLAKAGMNNSTKARSIPKNKKRRDLTFDAYSQNKKSSPPQARSGRHPAFKRSWMRTKAP